MATVENNFITEPDDALKCSICLEVAKNPKQEEQCGKLFCSDCIEKWKDSCPTCMTSEPRYFKDKKSHREIQALRVRCSNVESGCVWEGTIGTLQGHVDKCDFEKVPCPNRCSVSDNGSVSDEDEDSDVFHMLRSNIEKHLSSECPMRPYQCPDCGLEDKYQVITGPHEDKCEKKIVTCPNDDCKVSLERRLVQDHVQKLCDYTKISCKYANIGCGQKLMRKEKKRHESDIEYHFPIALSKISHLNNIIMHGVPITGKECRRRVTFKLEDYSKKKDGNSQVKFEPFFTSPTGYKMCFFVYANGCGIGKGSHLSVFTMLLHGPYDDQLEWPFIGTVTVELLNQEEDARHHKYDILYDTDMPQAHAGGGGLGMQNFISHENLAKGIYSQESDATCDHPARLPPRIQTISRFASTRESLPTPSTLFSSPTPHTLFSSPTSHTLFSSPTPLSLSTKPTPLSPSTKPTLFGSVSSPAPLSLSKPTLFGLVSTSAPLSLSTKPTPLSLSTKPTLFSPLSSSAPLSLSAKPSYTLFGLDSSSSTDSSPSPVSSPTPLSLLPEDAVEYLKDDTLYFKLTVTQKNYKHWLETY